MFKAFKYRLYPTPAQEVLLNRHFGACRFVYNLALETKMYAYYAHGSSLSGYDLMKQLTEMKADHSWLYDVASKSLESAINNLDEAYSRFYRKESGFPRFKNKHSTKSFSSREDIQVKNDFLFIAKFRDGLKLNIHRPLEGKIKNTTISKTPTGKYFASILCDTGDNVVAKNSVTEFNTIGIDLGIRSYAITSDGKKYNNHKSLEKSLAKLKFIDRKFSKYRGKRTKHKRALLFEKTTNQRKDHLHKLSTKLVRENQSIAIENLSIKEMMQTRFISLKIADASWATFVEMLKYKGDWYGCNILQIAKNDPSSKKCSVCGVLNEGLQLHQTKWECSCGEIHDRDINAAINIKKFALNNLSGEHRLKNQDELPALGGV